MSANRPTTDPADSLPLIRASELGQFSFCRRAWWLDTVKQVPAKNQAALTRGTQIHRSHSHQVRAAFRWRRAGFFLFGGGGLLLIMALIWLLLTFNI